MKVCLDLIEKRASTVEDPLVFPPLHDRIHEGCRSTSVWLLPYLDHRCAVNGDIMKTKEYLDAVGQNSSDFASRFRGALLGLALGDALGTTLEFSQRDSLPEVTSIIGGGPFGLRPGEWTDDTSMALCLAHSLVRKGSFNYQDQLDLYCLWWKKGIFSSNGRCFDIGNTVVDALNRYMETGDAYSGSTDPMAAGNGSLMRLAPVVLFYFSDPDSCVEWCAESSKTTHGAKEAVDACRYLGALLHGAIKGVSKAELTQGLYEPYTNFWSDDPLSLAIQNVAMEACRKSRDKIRSSGYVVHTLEAAIWAFHNTDTFEEGAILAANLGDDADTVAAVYGQLAGAYYGEHQINPFWIKKLSYFHVFYIYADKLRRFGLCRTPSFVRVER